MRARVWLVAAVTIAAVCVAAGSSAAASTPIENGDSAISYGGWAAIANPTAFTGYVRASSTKNDTVSFGFRGATFSWYTEYGPGMGEAKVTLDGSQTWTVDLYAAATSLQPLEFDASQTNAHHKVVIKVLGKHSASSAGNLVAINGIGINGKAPTPIDSPKFVYDQWKTTQSVSASGGSYQSTARKNASVSLTFTGVGVTWVTETDSRAGLADVSVDGADEGQVDLYAPATTWQVDETYAGLANTTHTITIRALGTHDHLSSGNLVVLDSLIAIPQPTLTAIAVTPGDSSVRQDSSLQYTATGTYSDGSTRDLTNQVSWSTSDASDVTINNGGLLGTSNTSHGADSINVTATLGAVSGATSVQVLCRLHSNGLGGTYADCSPLGFPGVASTYTVVMATEAAFSWGHGTNAETSVCYLNSTAPPQTMISIDNANGPSANWAYTNSGGTLLAGYVNENSTGPATACPTSSDSRWN